MTGEADGVKHASIAAAVPPGPTLDAEVEELTVWEEGTMSGGGTAKHILFMSGVITAKHIVIISEGVTVKQIVLLSGGVTAKQIVVIQGV